MAEIESDPKAITARLPLSAIHRKSDHQSDRMDLEDLIDDHRASTTKRLDQFQQRMAMLIRWLIVIGAIVLITLGMATASFGVQMWRIHEMASKGDLK